MLLTQRNTHQPHTPYYQHYPTGNNLPCIMLSLLLLAASMSSSGLLDGLGFMVGVDAAGILPTTITNGTYTSMDGTIPSSGTVLDVRSMLLDANSTGKTEASCELIRTTFNGTLTINLPTTPAAWDAIPLRLLIQDGISSGNSSMWPSTYIYVKGVLALGSNITVFGGSYDFTNKFIHASVALTIQDGSTFAVVGGTYRVHYPSTGDTTSFMYSERGLTILNRSTFSVSKNYIAVSNGSVSGSWTMTILQFRLSPVKVEATGSLSIIDNHVSCSDVNVSGDWTLNTLFTDTFSFTTISNTSTLAITHNHMSVGEVSVSANFKFYTLYSYSSSTTISNTSTLAITHNHMSIGEVSVSGKFEFYTLYPQSSSTTISSTSTLAITHNSVIASNLNISGTFEFYTLYPQSSSTTISNTSTLAITHNSASVSNVSVSGECQFYTLYSFSSPTVISSTSTLAITHNHMSVGEVSVSGKFEFYTLYPQSSSTTISSTSTLAITHNHMSVGEVSVSGKFEFCTLYPQSSSTTISNTSTLAITHNSASVSNVSVSGECQFYTLYIYVSPTMISNTSTLAIAHNSASVSNVSVSGKFEFYTLYPQSSSTTISSTSTLAITNNVIHVSNVSIGKSWSLYTLTSLHSPSTINTNSTLSISNNTVTASNVSTGNRWFVNIVDTSVSSPSTINTNATLIITNNTIRAVEGDASSLVVTIAFLSASDVEWTVDGILEVIGNEIELSNGFTISGSLTMFGVTGAGGMLGGTGDLYFKNNSIRVGSGGTVVSVSSSSTLGTPSIPSIHTCDNYVNGQCVMLLNGDYSCATGFNQTGVLAACASTPTTAPATPSSTISASFTATPATSSTISASFTATPATFSTAAPVSPAGPNATSPPTPLGDAEQTAIAVVAVTSADLQTVAAIGMLRCTPGLDNDVESEAGIRALVPVALSGTCAGAVQGALLSIGVACLLSVVAVCVVKTIKKGLSWVEAAAMVRCPSLVIAVWAFMQMGLVVCGARLVTAEDGTDVGLGVVGVMVGALLPAVCVGLARGVVSRRCYRLAQVPEAVAGRHWMVVWVRSVFLPSYELDVTTYPVSKAFSTVVGWTRRPSCLWAGLPVIQPVVMLLVVFVKGELCSVFLILAGVAMLLVGALCHVLFRPHRLLAANYLQGVAMALNAAMLFIASKLVGDPLNIAALDANAAIAMIQVALSVCRFAHTASYLAYMRLYGQATLVVCGADGSLAPIPPPMFDIQCKLCAKPTISEEVYADMLLPVVPIAKVGGIDDDVPPPMERAPEASPPPLSVTTTTHTTNRQQQSTTTSTSPPATGSSAMRRLPKPTTSAAPQTVRQLPSMPYKKASDFDWNPKYVPMERPYTMLYEDDFTPSDEKDDDLHLEMDNLSHSIELDDDDGENDDNIESQESDNSIIL